MKAGNLELTCEYGGTHYPDGLSPAIIGIPHFGLSQLAALHCCHERRHQAARKPSSETSRKAAEALLPLVYDELRKLARSKLRHEQPGQTLEATALVHEAYLRLVGNWGAEHGGRRTDVGSSRPFFRRCSPKQCDGFWSKPHVAKSD